MFGDIGIHRDLGKEGEQSPHGGFILLVTSEELRTGDDGKRTGNSRKPTSPAEVIDEHVGIEEDFISRGVAHAVPTRRGTER